MYFNKCHTVFPLKVCIKDKWKQKYAKYLYLLFKRVFCFCYKYILFFFLFHFTNMCVKSCMGQRVVLWFLNNETDCLLKVTGVFLLKIFHVGICQKMYIVCYSFHSPTQSWSKVIVMTVPAEDLWVVCFSVESFPHGILNFFRTSILWRVSDESFLDFYFVFFF